MKKVGMVLTSLLLVMGLVTGCGAATTPTPSSSSAVSADVKAIKDRGKSGWV